jgi:hypothetical protein
LDPDLFVKIIRVFKVFYEDCAKTVKAYLEGFAGVVRFEIFIKFLTRKEKEG